MIYRLIAFFASIATIVDDARAVRAQQMKRRYGWMPE